MSKNPPETRSSGVIFSIRRFCVRSHNPVEGGAFPGNCFLLSVGFVTENKKTSPRDRGKVHKGIFPFPAHAGFVRVSEELGSSGFRFGLLSAPSRKRTSSDV